MNRSIVCLLAVTAMFATAFPLLFGRDGTTAKVTTEAPAVVSFQNDIRPILSDKCFECHGPDSGARKGKLRLDTRDGAYGDRRGGPAVVPGNLDASLLVERVREAHVDDRMPPPEATRQLSENEVDLLVRWVEQGAPWEDHWSFVSPTRPEVPTLSSAEWVRDPIDSFVLRRLRGEQLSPSEEADRRTLIRRVTFDLTGLPPTLDEVRAFLADTSPDAYETLVDRLLDSPSYGEHMARYWLDATRYGDTHGLHLDNIRSIWPYRDWVVDAFNQNKPFDEFTVEQLAGDMLPAPTLEQQIATGFVRSNVTTNEGGSIVEEVYVRNVVDRTEAFGTIYLGMTVGCAACHDHKFDPLSQREFYELFAFFNSGVDNPMDGNRQDHAPVVKVPTDDQNEQLITLARQIEEKTAFLAAARPELDEQQIAWEAEWHAKLQGLWQTLATEKNSSAGGATFTVQPDRSVLVSGKNPGKDTIDVIARTDMIDIVAVKLDALVDPTLPGGGPSRVAHTNFVLSEFDVTAVSVVDPTKTETVEFVAASANYSQKNYHVTNAIDGDLGTGWAKDGKRSSDHNALFFARQPFGFEGGTELRAKLRFNYGSQHVIGRYRLSVTSDRENQLTQFGPWYTLGLFPAKSKALGFDTDFGPEKQLAEAGVIDVATLYPVTSENPKAPKSLSWKRNPELGDGQIHMLPGGIGATYLQRTVVAPQARKVTLSLGSDDGLKVWLNGKSVFEKRVDRPVAANQDTVVIDLPVGVSHLVMKVSNHGGGHGFYFRKSAEDVAGVPIDIASILSDLPEKRTDAHRAVLRDHYYATHAPDWREAKGELTKTTAEKARVEGMLPVSLVMKEMPKPKPAYLLNRGQYDDRGEVVTRSTPAALPPFPEGESLDRLGLARWLVDPAHPLTSRVIVNRFWQQYFGTGIVKTSEDFGSQGERPSHPQLLDWLATTFVESGWDVKALQRRIVNSSTYRQSSRVTSSAQKRDPDNRLFTRGPRFRMDAEVIRDSMLALGGLLNRTMGGPGVKSYQPEGIWKVVGYTSSNTANYRRDKGEALYRRSLYSFWKRTAPPPTLQLFDAPTREACTVRRSRTNTPTAALSLMNDIQFVEAARAFAQRILLEGGESQNQRLNFAFEAATARTPTERERAILAEALAKHETTFRADVDAASKLIAYGESNPDATLDPAELAAWTLVANLILNLHEVITKG